MKTKHIIAVALFGAMAFSARAQVAASVGDLILGFRQGTGGSSVEVDLGNINQFTGATAAGISGTLSLGNVSSLLTTAYGASWNSDATINWGVIGTASTSAASNGQAAKTAWFTNKATTVGSLGVASSTPFGTSGVGTSFGTSPANTVNVKVTSLYTGMAGGSGSAITTTSGNGVITSGTNTWLTLGGTSGGSFGATNVAHNSFDNQPASSGYSASDLYSQSPLSASTSSNMFFGTFALYANGNLSFTGSASAIPEPSTYAAILGAVALGFVALRRRQQLAVQAS